MGSLSVNEVWVFFFWMGGWVVSDSFASIMTVNYLSSLFVKMGWSLPIRQLS